MQPGLEAICLLPILDVLGLLGEVHVRLEVATALQGAHEVLRQPPMPGLVLAAPVAGRLPLRCDRVCEGPEEVVRF